MTEEGKDSVRKATLTSDTHFFQSLGVPKITLRFDHLRGLRGLTKSFYSRGDGLQQHRDAEKSRLGKRCMLGYGGRGSKLLPWGLKATDNPLQQRGITIHAGYRQPSKLI